MNWLIALGVVVAGVLIATFVSGRVRAALSKPKRSEQIRALAAPISSVVLSLLLGLAIVIALGIGDPEALKPLPRNLVAFVPRLLIAVLFILVGNGIAMLVANAVGASVLRASGRPQPQLVRVVRLVFNAIFALLAVGQIGIDTKIVDMISAGLIFSISLGLALLTGLGGRDVARNVAAGRYVRKLVRIGDQLTAETGPIAGITGTVKQVHGATIEMQEESGERNVIRHVPYHIVLDNVMRIERTNNGTPNREAANDKASE